MDQFTYGEDQRKQKSRDGWNVQDSILNRLSSHESLLQAATVQFISPMDHLPPMGHRPRVRISGSGHEDSASAGSRGTHSGRRGREGGFWSLVYVESELLCDLLSEDKWTISQEQ